MGQSPRCKSPLFSEITLRFTPDTIYNVSWINDYESQVPFLFQCRVRKSPAQPPLSPAAELGRYAGDG